MKILFGSIIVDARGRLNGHVFKKTAFGNSITALGLPRSLKNYQLNPALNRNAYLFALWNTLTAQQKAYVNTFALNNPIKNKFGVSRNIGGRNMFSLLCNNYRYPAIDMPALDILSPIAPVTELYALELEADTGKIVFDITSLGENGQIKIYVQKTTANRNLPAQNRWKRIDNLIYNSIGINKSPINVFQKLGVTPLGGKFWVKYTLVNSSGWAGATYTQQLSLA